MPAIGAPFLNHSPYNVSDEIITKTKLKSVKDIEGPWKGEASTGMLQWCKEHWETPLNELEDIMVVTYLNQRVALNEMITEAQRRLNHEQRDDSELYDGQLKDALQKAT